MSWKQFDEVYGTMGSGTVVYQWGNPTGAQCAVSTDLDGEWTCYIQRRDDYPEQTKGYIVARRFKTKSEALKFAKKWMREHLNG